MLSANQDLINHLYTSNNVINYPSCYIEYNMNSMVDDITVVSSGEYTSNGKKPYKLLFPADSIISPFRPESSGIKYYIYTSQGDKSKGGSISGGEPGYTSDPRKIIPPTNSPRVYLPGKEVLYKYWVTDINSNASITISYPKFVLSNKLIVKFEKYHQLPASCTITITYSDDSSSGAISATPNSDGLSEIYYDGSSWSTTESLIDYSKEKKIKSIAVSATQPSPTNNKSIAIIEVSPRLIRDISADVSSITINKESSSSGGEGILPVGTINSNTLTLDLSRYNSDELQYLSYDKSVASPNHLLTDKIYLFKNVEISPYFNIVVDDTTYKIPQGKYFINDYSVNAYGDVSITALDGAKYLMETIIPNILCKDYPVTAIITRLLDNVGFTNFNFNTTSTTTKVDDSIINVKYFWTDDSKTVWETLQELCRDVQMTALFDENNILQFYTRNYMYKTKTTPDFNFYYDSYYDTESSTNRIGNIISYNEKEIPSTNQVIVRWQVPQVSNNTQSGSDVWRSPTMALGAAALTKELTYPQTKETMPNGDSNYVVHLEPNVVGSYFGISTIYNYAGYFLIDSEVIEYDAVGYQYTPESGGTAFFWATSQTDVDKYKILAKQVALNTDAFFKPANVYRLKEDAVAGTIGRGMLGTTAVTHRVGQTDGWLSSADVVIK